MNTGIIAPHPWSKLLPRGLGGDGYMSRKMFIVIVFMLLTCSLFAQNMRVAMVDFAVHSDNPKYTYLGKGISEMIAMELANSPGVALVDREQRMELMDEMKFAHSGVAEETERQLEFGKMLAADYIIFGEIIDMDPQLLISIRVTGVDSGEVVYQDNLTERPGRYEYISGYLASAILDHFDVRVAQSTEKKVEEKQEKKEEAVVAFSRALAAYDKGEEEEAKKELVTAKKLDPEYEAVQVYLNKLITNTTKFKVKTEPFYSYQNPAYLGIMKTDNIHFLFSSPLVPFYLFGEIEHLNQTPISGTDKSIREIDSIGHVGYSFPIGDRCGMRIDHLTFYRADRLVADPEGCSGRSSYAILIDFGWQVKEQTAFGIGLTAYPRSKVDLPQWEAIQYTESLGIAGNFGFLYWNPSESFFYDSRLAWGNETSDIIDIDTGDIKEEARIPIYIENTLTLPRNEKRTFLIIKQLNDISVDRVYYFCRVLPAVEHFFSDAFSLRAGIEGSFAQMNDSSLFGYGAMGGLTFRFIPWGMDIDFNISYRLRPSRMKEEFLYKDFLILLSFSLNDLWISRE